MVQMKASCNRDKCHGYKIYIPHGSDERAKGNASITGYDVFISHMVQMKGKMRLKDMTASDMIYIPHGSDEREKNTRYKKIMRRFISHMVQMKVKEVLPILQIISHLYPTWFR